MVRAALGATGSLPEAGNDYLDDATAAAKSENFLFDELAERIAKARSSSHLSVANDEDTVDDATIHWPEDRTLLELGTLVLMSQSRNNDDEQKPSSSDPTSRASTESASK